MRACLARLTASPTPRTAFLVGLVLYAPSATFIAAVQVVATANAGVPVTAGSLALVVILTAAAVWVPLVAFLAAPTSAGGRARGPGTRDLRHAGVP